MTILDAKNCLNDLANKNHDKKMQAEDRRIKEEQRFVFKL